MMLSAMPLSSHPSSHQLHRHPALPWAELRISRQSCHSYRLHAHAQYSIGIVDEGETLFHHAQGPDRVRTGGVVLIEPGHWHACNPQLSLPWSYRMLFVQADWLHAQLGVCALQFGQRTVHDAQVSQLASHVCSPLAADADSQAVNAQTQALLQLLRQLGTPVNDQSPAPNPHNAAYPALELMHRHPEDEITLQSLAQRCGMSPTRFTRHFKALTGVTPATYRLNLRLNGARQLLAQGESLSSAAQHMGFADQAHMQRAFKAHHAMTPGNYAQG